MATNFDRFLAQILAPVAPQIQQATQGMDPRVAQQVAQMAIQDGVRGVNRFDQGNSMAQYEAALGPDAASLMASAGPVAGATPVPAQQAAIPVQRWTPGQEPTTPITPGQPVPNPNQAYVPPSDPQQAPVQGPPAPMPQVGRTTEDYVPSGTPLTEDEGFVAVEIMVEGPNGSLEPLRIMVPEHYVADGAPEGVTVFGDGQATPGTAIPDEFKLENQDEAIRWKFTDERDAAIIEQRDTPGSDLAIQEQRNFDAEPTAASLTPEQAAQRQAGSQGATLPQGPEPEAPTYSIDELADQELANKLRSQGITQIREDQFPLTDPQTGQVRLATEQEIIDENLPVPVEWIPAFAEDQAFLQQIKDAGITHIRADQMIVMDNGVLKLADAPETSNRELPGTPLEAITPEYLEQYDAGVANEMRQAGITEIPDGMALTRRDGRLQVLPAHTVDADEVIFYGGMSNRPDPGILRDSDGSFNIAGGLQDMIGTGIGALTGVANLGLGVLGNMTGRDLRINDEDVGTALQSIDDATRGQVATDVGNMVYEVTTGNDVDRRGWDWLNERLDFLNTRSTGPYGDMIAFYREHPELAEQLFTEGYDVDGDGVADFVGGRALWEYHVGNEQNMADRILGEIIMDPLNAVSLGAGGVTRTGLGLLRSGTRGGQLVGRPLYGVGRALQWIDEAPGRALLSPVRAVTNRPVRATNVPRRFGDSRVPDYIPEGSLQRGEFTGPIGRLLNPTNETRITRETEPYTEIVGDVTGSARGQSARMGIDPDDPLGGTPLGRARGPQGPTGPGMPSLDRLPQPIRDTLRTSDRAIYDRVVDGRLRPSQVLDADLLNNTGADGVLLPLNATQMARMTPGQIAVYEGLRLEQLRALDAMAPGSTAALERAEAQRRLDELLGEPEDAGPLLDAYGRPLGEEASMDLIEVRQQQRRPSRMAEASEQARTGILDDRAARQEAERRLNQLLDQTPDTPSDGLILPGTRGAAARRGIGVEPEAGPVPPRQAELAPTETQGTISAEAAPDTTPRQAELTPQQRDNVIREDEVVRQAEPEAATTQIDTTGPDLPADPGDGIPSPTPRDWGNFAPREGGDYLISRLWATRNEYPGRWRAFFDDVNARLREHTQRRGVSNQRSRQIREAAEADRQARLARGEDVSQAPARDFEGAAIDAVDDAEVLLEVYDAARRHYGDVADIRHTFANEYRTTTSRRGRQTNWYGQTDAYYIERAIFGSGRQSQAAFEQLRYKALEQGNTALQAELPRIERLRRQWEQSQGQQTLGLGRQETPDAEPAVRDTGMIASDEFEMGVVPVDSIRTTRQMTPEQMEAAGLPVQDFQNRTQDYAERTVQDMVNNYQSASMRPIQVVRGTDNNLYVLDGHSRLEAFKRMNRTEIPVQVVEGAPEEIARAADIANVVGTANTPIDQGRIAQRRIDAGESPSEVASAMKLSRREMDNLLALRHLDPDSELGRAVDSGQLDVARAAPLGRAISDGRLTMAEADAFYRNVVVPNDLTVRAINDEVSALYKFKIDEGGEGNTLFDLSGTESDAFWQARSRAAEVRKEIARLRRERAKYNSIEKRDGLSQRQKQSRRELDERIAELGNDEVAAESAARDAFYGDPVDTTPSMPEIDGEALLRPMTEADAAARRTALDQEGLDLGEAGRPVMQGGRIGTPGEALAPDDILTPQERSAADVMRESGARSLFGDTFGIVRDPRREAGEMADATRRGAQRVRDWWNEPVDGPMDAETRRTRTLLQTSDQLQDRNRDFIATDYRVSLTHDELVTLGRRIGTEPDSPTALQLWERYRDEAQREGADALEALEQGGMRMLQDVYADAMRKADPKKYAVYREAFDQYMEKKDADVTAAHIAAIKDANGDVRRVPEGYDTYLAVQREIRLYNPITGSRYIMTQAVGNSITAILGAGLVRGGAITRDMLAETGRDIAAYMRGQNRGAIADLRGGKDLRDFYETPTGGDIRRWAQEEDAAAPGVILDATDVRNIQRGFFENPTVLRVPREEGMGLRETGEMSQETMTRRWMESHRWTKPFSRGSGLLASERVRTVANAFDLSARKVTFDHQMAGMEAAMRPHFYEHAKAALPDGADVARFDQVWSDLPATFSDNHLRNALSEFGGGYAERIGRDWRSTQNAMRKEANAEVNRLFFTGQETNLDRGLRRVIMFHYWMSRATPLYTASLMKHVGLMENYFQMMHELQEQSEPYGKAVKGMLKLFSTTLGYNIFIRPDAMLQTVMALGGYEGGFDPENESGLVRFMRESGLMFNPFIMSALNYAGLSGDTFAPDPFSLHTHSAFAVAGIDFLKSVLPGIDTPTRNIYQEFNSWLRSETSEAAGVITGRDAIPFQRSDQFGQIEINNLIVDIALDERGMDWNDPQDQALIIAAMNDPESELYQAAFDRYAQANFTQQVLRIAPTSILYPKLRSAGKDERSLTIRTTERSDPENQLARDQRDMAQITDPDVRTLRVQQDEYQRIGSEEARDAYSTYNAIRFGPLQTPVVYNGVALSEGRLRLMDGDERKAIADAWAEQTGVSEQIEDIREQRKTYREQHPEYARYYDWQITVSDAEGGPTRYWQQLIKDNDNARRYYEGLQETESGDLDRRLTSVEAYLAAEGLRPTGYDPDPLDTGSGNPATMLSDYGLGAPGGYPPYEPVDPATRIREDLAEYYSQADAVDAQIKEIYGPDASLEKIMNANPMWRQGYLDRLAREGIEVPKLSKASQDYIAWAEAQPDGADTSVDAYVEWLDANETETTVTPEEAEERVRMGIGR